MVCWCVGVVVGAVVVVVVGVCRGPPSSCWFVVAVASAAVDAAAGGGEFNCVVMVQVNSTISMSHNHRFIWRLLNIYIRPICDNG